MRTSIYKTSDPLIGNSSDIEPIATMGWYNHGNNGLKETPSLALEALSINDEI